MKLAIRLILINVSLALVVVVFSGYLIFSEGERRWREDLDLRLKNAAVSIAAAIDQDALLKVQTPFDTANSNYEIAVKPLHEMLLSSSLNWAGVYYLDNNRFYYWIDDSYSGMGYPFFYATPEHYATYKDQQPRRIRYSDEFGTYEGYVAPLLKKNGGSTETLGLVEVVISQDAAQLLQVSTLAPIIGIILAAIAVFAVLAILGIHFSVSTRLQKLKNWALNLSYGNFEQDNITFQNRDELNELADAIREMVNYMRYIAQIADQITQGDLTGRVKPRSEQDVLGQSFARMSEQLSNLASAASQIAEGNLRVKIQPQSEVDVLGKAFLKMNENLKEMVSEISQSAASLSTASYIFMEATFKSGDSAARITAAVEQLTRNNPESSQAAKTVQQATSEMNDLIREIITSASELAEMAKALESSTVKFKL
jgi:methyl-accepting chemotaxis protein